MTYDAAQKTERGTFLTEDGTEFELHAAEGCWQLIRITTSTKFPELVSCAAICCVYCGDHRVSGSLRALRDRIFPNISKIACVCLAATQAPGRA